MSKKKNKSQDIIKKVEHHSFLKKFTQAELGALELEFSTLCVNKARNEQQIERLKIQIKSETGNLKDISDKINAGGESIWEDCDVEIVVSEMKKNYYFEGQLVDTEDADQEDLQLEIEENN